MISVETRELLETVISASFDFAAGIAEAAGAPEIASQILEQSEGAVEYLIEGAINESVTIEVGPDAEAGGDVEF